MSYKDGYAKGLAIGGAFLNLGSAFAGNARAQEKDALDAEKLEREKRVKAAAMGMIESPDSFDSTGLSSGERFDAAVHAAELTAAKQRNDSGVMKLRVQKRANNYGAMRADAQVMNNLLSSGDVEAASYKAKEAFAKIKDGWTAEIHKSEAANAPNTFTLTNQFTGETKTYPVNDEYMKEAAGYINRYRDSPKEADAIDRVTQAYIREENLNSMKNAEEIYSKDGKEFLGYTFSSYKKDEDGISFTEQQERVFLSPGLQPITEAALPGDYTTKKRAQGQADIAKSQYIQKKAILGGRNLTTPKLDKTFRTEGGKTLAPDAVGGYPEVPPGMVPKQNGRLTSVRDAKTGKSQQMTVKQVRANLKEAKAILKSVKDDAGNTFILPSLEQLQGASQEDKETVLGKIERLAGDPKRSEAVRTAANRVLSYLGALGITQTAGQAIGGGAPVGSGANAGKSWKDIREDLIRTKQGSQSPEPATLQ